MSRYVLLLAEPHRGHPRLRTALGVLAWVAILLLSAFIGPAPAPR